MSRISFHDHSWCYLINSKGVNLSILPKIKRKTHLSINIPTNNQIFSIFITKYLPSERIVEHLYLKLVVRAFWFPFRFHPRLLLFEDVARSSYCDECSKQFNESLRSRKRNFGATAQSFSYRNVFFYFCPSTLFVLSFRTFILIRSQLYVCKQVLLFSCKISFATNVYQFRYDFFIYFKS